VVQVFCPGAAGEGEVLAMGDQLNPDPVPLMEINCLCVGLGREWVEAEPSGTSRPEGLAIVDAAGSMEPESTHGSSRLSRLSPPGSR